MSGTPSGSFTPGAARRTPTSPSTWTAWRATRSGPWCFPPTGGWGTYDTLELDWAPIEGTHDVYIRFNDVYGVANLDKVRFGTPPPNPGANLVLNGDFETNDLSRWGSWTGATLTVSNEQAASGDQSLKVENGSANQWLQNATNVPPLTWTHLSGALVIPDCTLVDVAIYFEGTSADVDVFIDEVSVVAE